MNGKDERLAIKMRLISGAINASMPTPLIKKERKKRLVGALLLLLLPTESERYSPLPSSKKSVMVAEVQRLHGLEASMEVRMDDMSRLSLLTPKRSSQNLESSWDRPSR